MRILSWKPGHDGHIAALEDGELAFSMEAEKDSGPRYGRVTHALMMRALERLSGVPDVIAVSGWANDFRPLGDFIEGGYFGVDSDHFVKRPQQFLGQDCQFFSSSHERSHLLGSYAMSPYAQGEPVYALVWEGFIGSFYRINEDVSIERLATPLEGPGHKYAFIYGLADEEFPADSLRPRFEDAGKLMALASYGERRPPNAEESALIEKVLAWPSNDKPVIKGAFRDSPYFDVGLQSQEFKNLAWQMQCAIFNRFHDYAEKNMREGLPLLVSGGCGLNCDWNSNWKTSGLFKDVFVIPCANDSGSAIGTAVDAQFAQTGNAKIKWDVYAGEEFIEDEVDLTGITIKPRDDAEIAKMLASGKTFAWVQGRYEIGPRALGNRSLIAAPFTSEMHQELNHIKQREGFRPIAPICMEEEVDRLFEAHGPSPHMLFFQMVKTDEIKAVTHVDGSARLQSVNQNQNPKMHALLSEFKAQTGFGILCNTSLNYKGKGFINRLSDLVDYGRTHGVDGLVVGDKTYLF